jgi:glutamine amidotransferase-like uncharacterized protein
MNDVGRRDPAWFKSQVEILIDRVHKADPEIEIILVAPMLGNAEWIHTPREMFSKYRDALDSLTGPGVALADLTSVWETLLKSKHDLDLIGNGLNHPNDFGHRLYAQSILSLLVPTTPADLGLTEPFRINLELNLRWMLDRERPSAAGGSTRSVSPARVGVFADAGVWHLGARSIVDSLEKSGIACQVLDRTMLTDERLSRFESIVLPGGWAPYQLGACDRPSQIALRKFVERGGRCVGICAGAYLVSRTVRYDGQNYPYPLELFDGTAEGPVAGLAAWPDRGPVRLKVTPAGTALGLAAVDGAEVYYGGGPRFVGGSNVTALATYPDGTPAVIRRPIGKGEIVLAGVHFERPVPSKGDDSAPPPESAGTVLKPLVVRQQPGERTE